MKFRINGVSKFKCKELILRNIKKNNILQQQKPILSRPVVPGMT